MKRLVVYPVAALIFILNFPVKAQNIHVLPAFSSSPQAKVPSIPNAPQPVPVLGLNPNISSRNYVGAEIGINNSFMQGNQNFYYPINATNFNYNGPVAFDHLGTGFGFLIGGVLDLSLSDFFGLQGTLHYYTNNTGNTENQKLPLYTVNPTGPPTPNGTADVENTYSATLSHLGLDILGRLQFVPNSLYGLIGLGYSTVLSNTYKESQKFVDPNVQYLDQTSQQRSGFNQIDVGPKSASDYYNTVRGDVKVGIGTFIAEGESMVITPEILLSIPLTPLFNSATEATYSNQGVTTPKLWYAELSIGIKFPFGAWSELPPARVSNDFNSGLDNDGLATINGRVVDRKTNKGVDADMTVTDLNSNDVVANGPTDGDGNYSFKVKAPGRYSVTANAKDYLFGSAYYEIDGQGRILRGPAVIKLNEASGSTRLLVFFDFDKSSLQPSSYPDLNRAVQLMKANPDMKVEIAGYTDSKGTPSYNLDLSQRRANTVKDYLLDHGIAKSRVMAKGYGQDSPVESNDTEEGRAENRRVEFVVMNR